MIASKFFGFTTSYNAVDTIKPGVGYWLKVNQNGKLILSSGTQALPSTKIRIAETLDLPPAPPALNDPTEKSIPVEYSLSQNYPNPFNPTTTISYTLPEQALVQLTINNLLGQHIVTLVNEIQSSGNKTVEFNAGSLPSGVYYYRIHAGKFSDFKKMILLK
jgi:hypothetical protein